jgi:thiol-disulfide isomerase/thioredoxin
MRLLSIACLVALTPCIGCYKLSSSDSPANPARVGEDSATEAPSIGADEVVGAGSSEADRDAKVDLQILDWDGLQALLAAKRGKIVVLDCWSTSCAPCIKEFPNLVALSKKHSPDDLACISLSFDYEGIGAPEEQREHVLAFLQKQRATFDNVLSSVESDVLTEKLEIPSIPAVFVYDRDGKVVQRFDNRHASRSGGPFTYAQVAELVARLISDQPAQAE